ncbi:hypothetical protein [Bradyrhizobium sp.]|uniref:hypothetical protein n=1 Tax=Bradyrhizobium sp. TaxID=376 RepID=UPI0029BFC445|nr:hypothetical protein [Bradyrhizobium sp.]
MQQDLGRDRLATHVRPFRVLHGRDQPGQPKPAASLASPVLVLPFWLHRSPHVSVGAEMDNPRPAWLFRMIPERIRGDVICFT